MPCGTARVVSAHSGLACWVHYLALVGRIALAPLHSATPLDSAQCDSGCGFLTRRHSAGFRQETPKNTLCVT